MTATEISLLNTRHKQIELETLVTKDKTVANIRYKKGGEITNFKASARTPLF